MYFENDYQYRKIIFLLTESWIENKNCFRISGEHLTAIFRGMMSQHPPDDCSKMLRLTVHDITIWGDMYIHICCTTIYWAIPVKSLYLVCISKIWEQHSGNYQ